MIGTVNVGSTNSTTPYPFIEVDVVKGLAIRLTLQSVLGGVIIGRRFRLVISTEA